MDLIYEHKGGGKIYQCGYREVPRDLVRWGVDLVLYCARECPPLWDYFDQQGQATTHYFPNEDRRVPKDHQWYQVMLEAALPAAELLYTRVRAGQVAIVCCSQGVNRSGLAAGLAMKRLSEKDPEWVIDTIMAKRSGALSNGSFQEMIRDY